MPVIDCVSARTMTGPQIALGRLALSGGEVFDRCFVDLHVTVDELFGLHRLDHELEPLGDQGHAIGHRLARDSHSVSLQVDQPLSIEGQVVGVFADDDVGEQPRCEDAAFQKFLGKFRDDGSGLRVDDTHILRAHEATAQEATGFAVEFFADFLADAPPGFGTGFDRGGLENDFLDGQVLGQAGLALPSRFGAAGACRCYQCLRRFVPFRSCGGSGLSRAVEIPEEVELGGIDFFALRPVELPDDVVELLAEETVSLAELLDQFGLDSLQFRHRRASWRIAKKCHAH